MTMNGVIILGEMEVPLCGRRAGAAVDATAYRIGSAAAARRRGGQKSFQAGSHGELAFTTPKDKFAGFFTVCSLLFCLEKFMPLLL